MPRIGKSMGHKILIDYWAGVRGEQGETTDRYGGFLVGAVIKLVWN